MKFKNVTIIIVSLLIISIIFIFFIKKTEEGFGIDSELNKSAGFYSQFFFLLNHYLYCKENKRNFRINSENWIYKYDNGWTDYFIPTELNYNDEEYIKKGHPEIVSDYKLSHYQKAINEVYIYNNYTSNEIENKKKELNLIPYEYDSIFIRRGDKLLDESSIIYEEDYLKLLLSINPACNKIFVQTDDYNCFKNLQNIIIKNKYDINLSTLCENSELGTSLTKDIKNRLINNNTSIDKNKNYINNNNYTVTKSTEEMDSDEIKKHTLKMLIGIDIVRSSNVCVLDYQSNVGRFIKLSHSKPDSVHDVESKTNYIDYNKKICPAFSF
jgi:hypothetical protein